MSPRSLAASESSSEAPLASPGGGSLRSWKTKQAAAAASSSPSSSSSSAVDEISKAGDGSSLRSWRNKQQHSQQGEDSSKRSWRGNGDNAGNNNNSNSNNSSSGANVDSFSCVQEGHLAREAVLTVTDMAMLYVENHLEELMKPKNTLLPHVFDVLTHLLHVNQTTETIVHISRLFLCIYVLLLLFSNCSCFF
jgi:hypothetical protein